MILEACSIFDSATGSFRNWVRTLEASCSSAAMTDLKSMLFGSGDGRGRLLGFLEVVDLRFQCIVFVPGLLYFLPGSAELSPGPYKINDNENHPDERQVFEPGQIAVNG